MRRFTPKEDQTITRDWENHVLLRDIALKIDRTPGVVRQRVRYLKLHRSSKVTRTMQWAPKHLLTRRKRLGDDRFVQAVLQWREDERLRPEREEWAEILRQVKEIDARTDLSRNEKILAKRKAGLTLQEIGDEYGITRQRVLAICSDVYRHNYPSTIHQTMERKDAPALRDDDRGAASQRRREAKRGRPPRGRAAEDRVPEAAACVP